MLILKENILVLWDTYHRPEPDYARALPEDWQYQ